MVGVNVRFDIDHVSLTNNTVLVPTPPDSNAPFRVMFGFVILGGCDDLLVAENTFVGPGRVSTIQRVEDLNTTDPAGTALNIRTVGALQVDASTPISTLGRFSGNTFTGLDVAFQSSSNAGVVTRNTVTNSGLGISISNDAYDGSRVTDNVVALNSANGNQIGMAVNSGSGNVALLNNLQNNSVVGLAFVACCGGAASEDNVFFRNQGSVASVSGNMGMAVQDVLP